MYNVVVMVNRYFDGYVSGVDGGGSGRSGAFGHSMSILECNNGIKRKHFCFVDTKSINFGSEAKEKKHKNDPNISLQAWNLKQDSFPHNACVVYCANCIVLLYYVRNV